MKKINSKIDLVILAGGLGSRIKKYLKDRPKPMMKFQKFDFLDLLLRKVCSYDINKVFILAGYKGKKIKEKFHKKKINLVDIECIIEKKQMGTAGCLNQIKRKVSDNFIVINGDTFFDLDYNKIIDYPLKNKHSLITVVKNRNYKSNKKLINIKIVNNNITYSVKSDLINGGIYKFNKKIFNYIRKGPCSLENDVLPKLIKKKKVSGFKSNSFFLDIGTPSNLIFAKKKLIKYLERPAIFLDRDGTINEDRGYTHKIQDLKFKKGVVFTLKKLQKKNPFFFIVTNQAGIGKGYFSLNQFYKFQSHMKSKLLKEKIVINDVQFCPYHPKAKLKKFRKTTNLRKPGNQMIKKILKYWPIKKSNSVMIGDSKSDYLCAKKSNIKFLYTKINFKHLLPQIKI